MTKEQLIHRIKGIDDAILRLNSDKEELCKILIEEHCPYKVGQKARYVRIQTKRTGSVFNPKWEKVSEREEILVCVRITNHWGYGKFRYEFKRLKSDGTLTQNLVHVSMDEIEWLDEYYEPKK